MKKRFLIPAVTVAGLVGLAVLGSGMDERDLAECNAGDISACAKVSIESNKAEIVNQEWIAGRPAREKAAAKKARQAKKANKWQPTPHNVSMLALACENTVKPVLKDPRSFRRLNEGMSDLTDKNVTVWVNYTATNGFGGRVQNTKSCTYTR